MAGQLEEKGEYVVEYRMKKRDGSYIWVHDLGRRLTAEDGQARHRLGLHRHHAPRRRRRRRSCISTTISPARSSAAGSTRDFSVIDANDGLFEFLGYTREEFAAMGNRMSAVIYPEDLPGYGRQAERAAPAWEYDSQRSTA